MPQHANHHNDRVKHLSTEEKAVIEMHDSHGLTATYITRPTGSNRTTIVHYFCALRMKLGIAKRSKLKKVSGEMERKIVRQGGICRETACNIQKI